MIDQNNFFKRRQLPFLLFTVSILIVLTIPNLIQDGMFMDAMLYTSVSHNLSMGIGTFWFPQFSVHNIAGLSSFHEQPPLVFGIQSIFFRLLGDSMYVERFYTFLTFILTIFLIHLLWKEIFFEDKRFSRISWLPLLLWIIVPVCFWSYQNNMHENTMGIFILLSVLCIFKSFRKKESSSLLLLIAGLFILLATLSKGLPGLFPVVLPLLHWLITKRYSLLEIFWKTANLLLIPFVGYTILFSIPESRESLSIYLFKRALHRINDVPTVSSHFYILIRLFSELIPPLTIVIVFLVIRYFKSRSMNALFLRNSLLFICIGFAASLPLMLTRVQKGFYFVPALPFFAIGLSLIIIQDVTVLTERVYQRKKLYKSLLSGSIFLILSTLIFSCMQIGKTRRYREVIHDVYEFGKVIPKKSTVSIPEELWNEWDLQCYLMRYFNISLESGNNKTYYILDKSMKADSTMNFKKVDLETLQYDLYRKEVQ
jgi:4-amino-4-deoxy-L-arabinose transferase-like glycosyltransferase